MRNRALEKLAYPLLGIVRSIPAPVLMVGAGLFLLGTTPGQNASRKLGAMAGDLSDQIAVGAAAEAIDGPRLDLVLLEVGAVNLKLSYECRHDRDVVAGDEATVNLLVVGLPAPAKEVAPHAALAVGGIRDLHVAETQILDVADGSIRDAFAGVKNVYVAQDGSYFIGGSMTGGLHGLVVGVKAFAGAATNASWAGMYFAAGMRYDTPSLDFVLPNRTGESTVPTLGLLAG